MNSEEKPIVAVEELSKDIVSDSRSLTFRNTTIDYPRYLWEPKVDITTYELSLCIPALIRSDGLLVGTLPPYAQRHFKRLP